MLDLRASRASESFARLFKGGLRAGAAPLPALRRARNSLSALISAGGGLRGNPRRGFPLFFTFVRVRRYVGRWSLACPAFRPHFFGACPKKRCRAAKEKRFFTWYLHHSRERYCLGCLYSSSPDFGKGIGGYLSAQVSLTQSAVMLGLRVRGRGGWDRTAAVAAPKSAFLWGSTPFLCARAKKWGGTGSRGERLLPKETAHT